MAITFHSRSAVVAYQDLRRLLLDDRVSGFAGTIEERRRAGRIYLYERFRLGTEMKSRYLGEDTPELRTRIDAAASLREDAAARRARMSKLAAILRAEGFIRTDRETGSALLAFAKAGMFRLGGTLVGTSAFALYEGELGLRMSYEDLAQTGDIDIASFERLSVALEDRVTEPPADTLAALKFDPVPSLEGAQVWRWRQSRSETLVEFLTPAFGAEDIRPLPALGVSAQALNYLNYLIAEPVQAVALYRAGVLVQIPRPERFALHKLIVADRRRTGPATLKARKARAQAALLIEALSEERPDELKLAWEEARAQGPRWRARIEASLARMPETRARLEALDAT